ncbi:reverse transcriptase domain-containing protein [Piscirickettsia salmonis]|uniref:reverse transcriptase domain-containing protein n=1 Tax=Piscirickettsia salmonis TaxID=1238 RepID=UPI003EB70970
MSDFLSFFSEEEIKEAFFKYVSNSNARGIDSISSRSFEAQIDEQIKIINRKVADSSYKLSKYKSRLISKGKGRAPREISIPTVRDRVVLRKLCDFLQNEFSVSLCLPQNVVNDVINDLLSGTYSFFIKLDVSEFYPSVDHKILMRFLSCKNINKKAYHLIFEDLIKPTVKTSKCDDSPSTKGIPQGLSISNVLAAIYLNKLDEKFKSYLDIKYYRYVDDVLVFCKNNQANLACEITKEFEALKLKVHDFSDCNNKSRIGHISNEFSYLGYSFHNNVINARIGSINKLKDSLVSIFINYRNAKRKSEKILLWKLNLRITGCVFKRKSRGWLFFFSLINNEQVLHQLDSFVKKLFHRFNLQLHAKSFVRTFYEIKHKRHETNYIPNFDKLGSNQKREILKNQYGLEKVDDNNLDYLFNKRIGKEIKDLEEDIQAIS